MKADADLTIQEARDLMRPKLYEGTKCVCCGQLVRMYKRPLTSSMAYGLILIYCHHRSVGFPENNWIHLEDFFKALDVPSSIRGDLPKLRFWGFLQQDGEDKEDGNPNSGMYKITENGKLFVEGKILAPKHVKLYNNRKFKDDDDVEHINVLQALKNKFDYSKLMGVCL